MLLMQVVEVEPLVLDLTELEDLEEEVLRQVIVEPLTLEVEVSWWRIWRIWYCCYKNTISCYTFC